MMNVYQLSIATFVCLMLLILYLRTVQIILKCICWFLYFMYGMCIEYHTSVNSLNELRQVRIRFNESSLFTEKVLFRFRFKEIFDLFRMESRHSGCVLILKVLRIVNPTIDLLMYSDQNHAVRIRSIRTFRRLDQFCVRIHEVTEGNNLQIKKLAITLDRVDGVWIHADHVIFPEEMLQFQLSTTSNAWKPNLPRSLLIDVEKIGVCNARNHRNFLILDFFAELLTPCPFCVAEQPIGVIVKVDKVKEIGDSGQCVEIVTRLRLVSKAYEEISLLAEKAAISTSNIDTLIGIVHKANNRIDQRSSSAIALKFNSLLTRKNKDSVYCEMDDLSLCFRRGLDQLFPDKTISFNSNLIEVSVGSSEFIWRVLRFEYFRNNLVIEAESMSMRTGPLISGLVGETVKKIMRYDLVNIDSQQSMEMRFDMRRLDVAIVHSNGDILRTILSDIKFRNSEQFSLDTRTLKVTRHDDTVVEAENVQLTKSQNLIKASCLGDTLSLMWSPELELFIRDLFVEVKELVDMVFIKESESTEQSVDSIKLMIETKNELLLHLNIRSINMIVFSMINVKLCFVKDLGVSSIDVGQIKCNYGQICLSQMKEINIEKTINQDSVEGRKIMNITMDTFEINVPHDFIFHNVWDQISNVYIWRKRLNRQTQLPTTDCLICIKLFRFVFEDDPFEVRLNENHLLMVDEESEIRDRNLELNSRIRAARLQRHISKQTEIDAYQLLKEKNAKIYIERSRKLYGRHRRVEFFTLSINDLRLGLEADERYSSPDNIKSFINKVDENGLKNILGDKDYLLSSYWSRYVRSSVSSLQMRFRDFRKTLLDVKSADLEGQLACVEIAQSDHLGFCERFVKLEMDGNWNEQLIRRLIVPKKFFHDFTTNLDYLQYAFGPCWEGCVAQLSIYLRNLLQIRRDPSPRLSWWDVCRYHSRGHWRMQAKHLSWIFHASLNPYNVSEEVEWLWYKTRGSWYNGKFILNGSMWLKSRMRSKYNDSSMVNIPNVHFILCLLWVIDGPDPDDHYSIKLWNRDMLEFCECCRGDLEIHDAYRQFRSKSVDMTLTFCDSNDGNNLDHPSFTAYASTLRFCSRVIRILMSVARPIRSGALFNRQRRARVLFSRHYRKVRVIMNFSVVSFNYWNSFACQSGLNAQCHEFKFDCTHVLSLYSWKDNLLRRKRVRWKMYGLRLEMANTVIHLLSQQSETNEPDGHQRFLMNIGKIRVETCPAESSLTYVIRLRDLRALWDYVNRDLVVELIDTYLRSRIIRQCLTSRILYETNIGGFKIPTTGEKTVFNAHTKQWTASFRRRHSAPNLTQLVAHTFRTKKPKSPPISEFLHKLLDRYKNGSESDQSGNDDVLNCRAEIEIVNGQVAMRSCEKDTNGYMIVSFGESLLTNTLTEDRSFALGSFNTLLIFFRIFNTKRSEKKISIPLPICQSTIHRLHIPVRRGEEFLSKQCWRGTLQWLQCFGTVGGSITDDIVWISNRYTCRSPVRSNQLSVGQTIRIRTFGKRSMEFLVVIERCCCDICFVSFDPLVESQDSENVIEALQSKQKEDPSSAESTDSYMLNSHTQGSTQSLESNTHVDTLTVVHHDLRMLTNSVSIWFMASELKLCSKSIYQSFVDIVNDLLLYMRPTRRTPAVAKLKVMLEAQVLDTEHVFINKIMKLKEKVRANLSELRVYEKELFYLTRPDVVSGIRTTCASNQLKDRYSQTKQRLFVLSDRLSLYLSVMKELKLVQRFKFKLDDGRVSEVSAADTVGLSRRYEIFIRSGQWTLTTDERGCNPYATLHVANALYRKTSFDNCANEHIVQIGDCRMESRLKDDFYECVLAPLCNQPEDMIYLYCRESLPVGGIAIREHFELVVSPIRIQLTQKFFNECMRFFFSVRQQEPQRRNINNQKFATQQTDSSVYFDSQIFDEMSKRAAHNNVFMLIRVSEVPICASYKSNTHKKLMDLHEKMLIFPSLEYVNKTWTWHDFVIAIKNDVKRVLLSQAIKHKLGLPRRKSERKAKLSDHRAGSLFNKVLMESTRIILPALHSSTTFEAIEYKNKKRR